MCEGKDVISFTVPLNEPKALEATGNMLLHLAGKTPIAWRNDASCERHTVTEAPRPIDDPDGPFHIPTAVTPPPVPDVPAAFTPPPEVPAVVPPAPEVPAAVPPAPAAPTTVPGTAVPVGELDPNGFPWDERIHAKTKTKMQDGTWKLKRGSDPALVEQVRAEFIAACPPPVAEPNTATTVHPDTPGAVPAVPAAPVPSAPPAVAPVGEMTYPALIAEITGKKALALITDEEITSIAQALGLPAFPALAAQPELISVFYDAAVAIWTPRIAS